MPTGPPPKTAMVSPGLKPLRETPCHPVGKMSASKAKSASCSVPAGRVKQLKSAYGTLKYCAYRLGSIVSVHSRLFRAWLYLSSIIWTHGNITIRASSKALVQHQQGHRVMSSAFMSLTGLTPVQKAVLPSSQLRHRPSATLNGITTRSPFLSNTTPAPASIMTPIFSWPKINPVPPSAAVRPSYLADN